MYRFSCGGRSLLMFLNDWTISVSLYCVSVQILIHSGLVLCGSLLPTCQTRRPSSIPAAVWPAHVRMHARAHMRGAVKCTHTHTHTHNPPTCTQLLVWISKNKDDSQKPRLLDEAFKNADEPQRTLHLVPDQPAAKARYLICAEERPTAGQSKL